VIYLVIVFKCMEEYVVLGTTLISTVICLRLCWRLMVWQNFCFVFNYQSINQSI